MGLVSRTNLKARASTRNTKGKRGTTSNMGIVTLAEELDDSGNLARILEQQEGKTGHRSTPDVVGYIGYSDMKKPPDRIVVRGTGVGQGQGVDASVSQNGVLRINEITISIGNR